MKYALPRRLTPESPVASYAIAKAMNIAIPAIAIDLIMVNRCYNKLMIRVYALMLFESSVLLLGHYRILTPNFDTC